MEIYDLDLYFWKNIAGLKTENTFHKIELFHKSYTTAVAMATMTCQLDGGYFGFKLI